MPSSLRTVAAESSTLLHVFAVLWHKVMAICDGASPTRCCTTQIEAANTAASSSNG